MGEDFNKGINNLNGVFSGDHGTTGSQNWSGPRNIVQYILPRIGVGVTNNNGFWI
jgi:hypothetical protein